ncbi:hypothetical protein [Moraxella lincolnii]
MLIDNIATDWVWRRPVGLICQAHTPEQALIIVADDFAVGSLPTILW